MERPPPTKLAGYRVVRRLATGGTSDVLLARVEAASGAERLVVLKLLLPHFREDPEFERMFATEAAAYARLTHPCIVRLFDFFRSGEELVMVLEYVDGLPLNRLRAALQAKKQHLDDRAVIWLMGCVFSALAAAHAAKDPANGQLAPVIHRDVNPSNVLIPWDGYVKLADFGIAKVTGIASETKSGLIKGTFGYMAPEQVRGEAVGPAADVYAATLLLWELLAHRRAIQPAALPELEVMRAMAHPSIVSLNVLRPDLAPALRVLVGRGLVVEQKRRDLTALEAAAALQGLVGADEGREALARALTSVRPPGSYSDSGPDVGGTTIDESSPEARAGAPSLVPGPPIRLPDDDRGKPFGGLVPLADVSESDLDTRVKGTPSPAPARPSQGKMPAVPRPASTSAMRAATPAPGTAGGAASASGEPPRAKMSSRPPVPRPSPSQTNEADPPQQPSTERGGFAAAGTGPREIVFASLGEGAPALASPAAPPATGAASPTALPPVAPIAPIAPAAPMGAFDAPPPALYQPAAAPSPPFAPAPAPAAPAGYAGYPLPPTDLTPSGAPPWYHPPPMRSQLPTDPSLARFRARRRGRALALGGGLAVVVGVLAGGAFAVVHALGHAAPAATRATAASSATAATVTAPTSPSRPDTATPTADTAPTPAPTTAPPTTPTTATPRAISAATEPAAATTTAGTAPSTAGKPAAESSTGTIVVGATASGHRVFVDSHMVGEGPGRYAVRCGPRSVKVGSHGRAHTVDVPCGGEVTAP